MPSPEKGYTLPVKTRWLFVLPPEGAARQAGLDLRHAALSSEEEPELKVFDTKGYLDGFAKLLRDPDDDMRVDLMNQALIVAALDHRATHVLVVALAPLTVFTLRLLRQQGMKLVHWFIEDFRQAHYWKQVLPAYHAFCAIQRGPVAAACAKEGVTFKLLPTAASETLLQRQPASLTTRSLDLAFVGLPSPYRVKVLEALWHAGARLRVGGSGWQHYQGPLESVIAKANAMAPLETWTLLEQAKLGLHIPYEDPEDDRGNSHVSPRIYDLMALHCLPLVEAGPMLREALEGCEIQWFHGPEGAVQSWRENKDRAISPNAIAGNASLTRARHGYGNRWRAMQNLIREIP